MSRYRIDLIVDTYPEGDRWTWQLWHGSREVATSGSQLFSRRIGCARGAETGTGFSGVETALIGKATPKSGRIVEAGIAYRRLDGATVRLVDKRGAS